MKRRKQNRNCVQAKKKCDKAAGPDADPTCARGRRADRSPPSLARRKARSARVFPVPARCRPASTPQKWGEIEAPRIAAKIDAADKAVADVSSC